MSKKPITKKQAETALDEGMKLFERHRVEVGKSLQTYRNESIPQLMIITKEKYDLAHSSAIVESDYRLKNIDTLVDILKVIVTVCGSILVASNILAIELKSNLTVVVIVFVLSIIGLAIAFNIRKGVVNTLIAHLGKLEASQRKIHNSTFEMITENFKEENKLTKSTLSFWNEQFEASLARINKDLAKEWSKPEEKGEGKGDKK